MNRLTYIFGLVLSGTLGYLTFKTYNKYRHLYKFYNQQLEASSAVVYDNHIDIPYLYLNKKYRVKLPYHLDQVSRHCQWLVTAEKDGQEVDITQQPGIPYFVTSQDLGVDHIYVYDYSTETKSTL